MSCWRRFFQQDRHYYIALGIVLAALLFKCYYIFHCTTYQSSQGGISDMREYWIDSLNLAWGHKRSLTQWGGFAPFYKYFFLVPFFKIVNFFNCLAYALTILVFIHILLYAISSWFFYLMVERLIVNRVLALMALVFYAFSYLALYVHAMVLPDTLGISLLVIATSMVSRKTDQVTVLVTGFLLGIAIAAKPFYLMVIPLFGHYIFFKNNKTIRSWKVMVFVVALVFVPLMTMANNYYLSKGKLKSIAAIGGVNFLQGWGKLGLIQSITPEGEDARYSPGALDELSWKPLIVHEPWYHQGYFYHLAFKAIARDPMVIVEKVFWFGKFFWGIIRPCLSAPPVWYYHIMPGVQNMSYLMFVYCWVLFLFIRRHADFRTARFLIFFLGLYLIFIYIIGLPERRYYLNIEFLVIALFFMMIDLGVALYKIYRKEIWLYVFLVFSLFICIPATWAQLKVLF